MKLHEGNVFIGLRRAPAGGWMMTAEGWPGGGDQTTLIEFEEEPAYDSFVVSIGELIAEMLGEPE